MRYTPSTAKIITKDDLGIEQSWQILKYSETSINRQGRDRDR
jgi:hypothetical protein